MIACLDFVPSKCWVNFKCLLMCLFFPPQQSTCRLYHTCSPAFSFTFSELSTRLQELNLAFWFMSKNEPIEFLLICDHQLFNRASPVFGDVSFHGRRAVNTCKVIIATKCCWPGIWICNCSCHLLIVLFESLTSSYTFTWHLCISNSL